MQQCPWRLTAGTSRTIRLACRVVVPVALCLAAVNAISATSAEWSGGTSRSAWWASGAASSASPVASR